MSDKGWTTSTPMLAGVRSSVRKAKRIDHDVLQVGGCPGEQRVIDGALKNLKRDHPTTWASHEMLGSLLKRMRNQQVAA
jgi:hypothetical protein